MTETTAPASLGFLLARLEAARTSPESFDLDGLPGEAVRALTAPAARWESLKAYLETERVSNAAEAREWQHGSPAQAGYASRSIMAGKALAKMAELEDAR